MDRKDRTIATSIKIPKGLLKWIDIDVEKSEEYTSRTDWIVSAIQYYVEKRTRDIEERKKIFYEGENNQEEEPEQKSE